MHWKQSLGSGNPAGSDGPVSRLRRLVWPRLQGFHLFVVETTTAASAVPFSSDDDDLHSEMEIRKIASEHDPDIDALIALDGMKKAFAVDAIRQGNHCYVARRGGRVIAVTWSTQNATSFVKELGRELRMSEHETYGWGAQCASDLRGRHVMPRLLAHCNADLAQNHGKSKSFVIVLTSNSRALRSLTKLGCRTVGRIGFLQLNTFRLHYLVGRNAFSGTRRRVYAERVWA